MDSIAEEIVVALILKFKIKLHFPTDVSITLKVLMNYLAKVDWSMHGVWPWSRRAWGDLLFFLFLFDLCVVFSSISIILMTSCLCSLCQSM